MLNHFFGHRNCNHLLKFLNYNYLKFLFRLNAIRKMRNRNFAAQKKNVEHFLDRNRRKSTIDGHPSRVSVKLRKIFIDNNEMPMSIMMKVETTIMMMTTIDDEDQDGGDQQQQIDKSSSG